MTPDLLGVLNREGRFTHTNPAWFKVLGFTAEEIESRPFFDLIHPDDLRRTHVAFERVNKGYPILNFVNRHRRKDGGYEWLSWNAVPEDDLFFCSGRCITSEKENEAALKTREDEAKLREQFIAVLGHDVRNPLTAIDAAARVIGRTTDDARVHEMLRSIEGSSGRIARLIDDVMDFARARLGGGMNIDRDGEYDVKPILEHTAQEISLAHPDVEIITEYDFCDPIHCDPDRMSQLVSNLLANAVTHGEPGASIEMGAEDRDGWFYLWVANRGAPIPPEAREMLFQPYTRADMRQSQQGLGLGLFIAREIARGHDGELTVESNDERTVFTFCMQRL